MSVSPSTILQTLLVLLELILYFELCDKCPTIKLCALTLFSENTKQNLLSMAFTRFPCDEIKRAKKLQRDSYWAIAVRGWGPYSVSCRKNWRRHDTSLIIPWKGLRNMRVNHYAKSGREPGSQLFPKPVDSRHITNVYMYVLTLTNIPVHLDIFNFWTTSSLSQIGLFIDVTFFCNIFRLQSILSIQEYDGCLQERTPQLTGETIFIIYDWKYNIYRRTESKASFWTMWVIL